MLGFAAVFVLGWLLRVYAWLIDLLFVLVCLVSWVWCLFWLLVGAVATVALVLELLFVCGAWVVSLRIVVKLYLLVCCGCVVRLLVCFNSVDVAFDLWWFVFGLLV